MIKIVFQKGNELWKKRRSYKGKGNPMYGKKQSKESNLKNRLAHLGDKNSNWKGGITPEYHKIHISSEFRKKREIILKRDNFTCRRCNKPANTIDFIIPWRISKDLSITNLQTLCRGCNATKGRWEDSKIWK